MATRDLSITLHEELDRRETLIKQLDSECTAIRQVLALLERPENQNRVTPLDASGWAIPPKTRRATGGSKQCKRCAKGPSDGAEFGKHAAFTDKLDNHCKQCRREMRQAKKPKGRQRRSEAAQASSEQAIRKPDEPAYPDTGGAEESFSRIADAATRRATTPTNGSNGEFVYSTLLTCPKCGTTGARLRRRKEANLEKDYWICEAKGCQLKIANYSIKIDRSYGAGLAAGA